MTWAEPKKEEDTSKVRREQQREGRGADVDSRGCRWEGNHAAYTDLVWWSTPTVCGVDDAVWFIACAQQLALWHATDKQQASATSEWS